MALWFGARGPHLIQCPAARAFDFHKLELTETEFLAALAAANILQNCSVISFGRLPRGWQGLGGAQSRIFAGCRAFNGTLARAIVRPVLSL